MPNKAGLIFLLFLLSAKPALAQVVINEISSYESSGDWVEIYSPEEIDISGWILRDSASSIVKTIPENTIIKPDESKFFIVEAGKRLNKDKDTIRLLKEDDATEVDKISYGPSNEICAPESGQSIGRKPDGESWTRFSSSTKNSENIAPENPCPTPTLTPTPTPTSTPTPTPTSTSTPTATPIPTQTPVIKTKKASPKPIKIPTPTPTQKPKEEKNISSNKILAAKDEQNTPPPEPQSPRVFPLVLIFAGLICIAGALSPLIIQATKHLTKD